MGHDHVDSSAAYLHRQSLNNVADGAALAGAQEVRGSGVYGSGLDGERAPLDAAQVQVAVADYLRASGAYVTHPGLTFRVRVDDRAVVVTMRAPSSTCRSMSRASPIPMSVPVGLRPFSSTTRDDASAVAVRVPSSCPGLSPRGQSSRPRCVH